MNLRILSKTKLCCVLLVLSAGLARAATPSPSPAPSTPAATPTPAAAASSENARYDGVQQGEYIATAGTAFTTQRKAKFQAFLDARTAFETAGGITAKGLTSKAAVTERRALLTTLRAAADDYLAFTTTQEDAYRAELAKTPLIPNDINSLVAAFAAKADTPRAIQVQTMEKDLLACSDEKLGDLEKWSGNWSVDDSGKIAFKKKANLAAYIAVEEKYNRLAVDMQKLQTPPAPAATPTPGATPSASASVAPAAAAP